MKSWSPKFSHLSILACFIIFIGFSLLSPNAVSATCTQVPSNITSCVGTQTNCVIGTAVNGNINRYCCDTSADCVAQKTKSTPSINAKATTSQQWFPDSGCSDGINTALGCLPYKTDALGPALFGFLVGFAGMIALFLMLFASSLYMTAGGDHEKLKKAKELFTAAITGLIFIVFSVVLLRITAGNILQIPGF